MNKGTQTVSSSTSTQLQPPTKEDSTILKPPSYFLTLDTLLCHLTSVQLWHKS